MTAPLKGHSPQAYSREVNKFRELLEKCQYVSFVSAGSYCNIGARKSHIVFKPNKVPNMLAARFQDGQAAYWWHLGVKEVSVYACAQDIESTMHAWRPEIIVTYRGFSTKEGANHMTQTTNGALPDSLPASKQIENSQEEKHPNGIPLETPKSPDHHLEENAHVSEKEPIQYTWGRDDAEIYHTLKRAAKEQDNGAEVFDYADFYKNAVYGIIKTKTGLKNERITLSLKRLKKAKIWIEFDDGQSRLMFMENVPEYTHQAKSSDTPPADSLLSAHIASQPSRMPDESAVSRSCSIQKRVLATALQAIEDEHMEIRAKVSEYNKTIEWIITAFRNILTTDKIRFLRKKILT